MLYQEIHKKNSEFNNLLINNKKDRLRGSDIVEFLDALGDAIPLIHDSNNYKLALSMFLKWETILFNYFEGIIYSKTIRYKLSHDRVLSNDTINKQLGIVSKIQDIMPSTNVKNTVKFFESIDPINSTTIGGRINKNIKILQNANLYYKKSEIDTSTRYLQEIINKMERKRKFDTISMFYLSWAYHALGNNFCVCEKYQAAHHYYRLSVKLKKKIIKANKYIPEGMLLLSYYSSKSKYIYLSQFFQPNNGIPKTIKKLNSLLKKLERKKETLERANKAFYYTIINNIIHYTGKNHIYNSKTINSKEIHRGLKLFEKSMHISLKTNNSAGVLKNIILLANHTPNLTIKERISLIDNAFTNGVSFNPNDPNLKALIGESHKAEYAVENSFIFSNEISNIFSKHGISPHGRCSVTTSCNNQTEQIIQH